MLLTVGGVIADSVTGSDHADHRDASEVCTVSTYEDPDTSWPAATVAAIVADVTAVSEVVRVPPEVR